MQIRKNYRSVIKFLIIKLNQVLSTKLHFVLQGWEQISSHISISGELKNRLRGLVKIDERSVENLNLDQNRQ